jgi:uncharacterized protein (DUF2336 family)
MSAVLSLIPELEQVVVHGSREKRADTLQRITTLFVHEAGTYNELHIDLFDDVLGLLVENVESKARTDLSVQLAPLTNAPSRVLRTLARDDDIAIAGPVLLRSPCLRERDLIDIANTMDQAHQLAIAARPALSKAIVDALVRRGDPDVVRRVTDNRDHVIEVRPEKFPTETAAGAISRDYSAAERSVRDLSSSGQLTEAAVVTLCQDNKYEEAVVALAMLAKVPLNIADRAVSSERTDPVLILCRAAGLGWPTANAIFLLRPNQKGTSNESFDAASANYDRLSASTAQRVVRFWQARRFQ